MLAFLTKWPEKLSASRALALIDPSWALGRIDAAANHLARLEPTLGSALMLLGPPDATPINEPANDQLIALPAPQGDAAFMSPRELAEWAHEMYIVGALNWEEYRLAGFPSELHPDYDRTIGALTGQPARPDEPRDMLAEWQARAEFERRYNGDKSSATQRAEHIVSLLRTRAPEPQRVPA